MLSPNTEKKPYAERLSNLRYAYGYPDFSGVIKAVPSDFVVVEQLDVEISNQGEHFWLDIRKTGLSSDRVAKALARHSNVAYRDVGYSGMKDVQAVTRQWFSVWMPKQLDFDWSDFAMDDVEVLGVYKHSRKIKRGTHKANYFEIRVTDLSPQSEYQNSSDGKENDFGTLQQRLEIIKHQGVPNYFGEQRFGRNANNLARAQGLFARELKIKDRSLKSIVLSSARSFLFNLVVSARIKNGTWQSLFANEPAALDGSNAIFTSGNDAESEVENEQRLQALDIHPTAPLWGKEKSKRDRRNNSKNDRDASNEEKAELKANAGAASQLVEFETAVLAQDVELQRGLEQHGLDMQRRALRCVPKDMQYHFEENSLVLKFTLQAGQFATSVLRELVTTQQVPSALKRESSSV